MGAGKGFDYYRNNYTHEQLWQMVVDEGDAWSVEQAGSVWRQARQGIESAETGLDTAMSEVVDYWQGDASEEFQRRMEILREYGQESSQGMERAETVIIPKIAGYLKDAQDRAATQDLYPSSTLTQYEDWVNEMKPEDLSYGSEKEQTQRPQLQQEHQAYLEERHDAVARIVADLGDQYQEGIPDDWREPPPPPPSDMPGNETFQPPTGGVFGNDGLNSSGALPSGPGSPSGSTAGADGIIGTDDDLEPVGGWAPGSYTDLDSDFDGGGLASGGIAATGGNFGGPLSTSGVGGSSAVGAGAGLFGPAKGGGAGSAPGRGGAGTNSPARSGATKSTSPTTNPRGSGSGRGTGTSSSGRGSANRGMGPRGGTRSGYYDDDEEEETTRETWLKEDDINWGDNRTPDEELDD